MVSYVLSYDKKPHHLFRQCGALWAKLSIYNLRVHKVRPNIDTSLGKRIYAYILKVSRLISIPYYRYVTVSSIGLRLL